MPRNTCNYCQNCKQSQGKKKKSHNSQRTIPPTAVRTTTKRSALTRNLLSPQVLRISGEYASKDGKILALHLHSSLSIPVEHNQIIYTDLNRPSAGVGKGRSPLASLPPSHLISFNRYVLNYHQIPILFNWKLLIFTCLWKFQPIL